jgi:hypothetical protein
MANAAIFRIYAGNLYVSIKVITKGIDLESLLEVKKREDLENSPYLTEPVSSKPDEIRSFFTAMKKIEISENHDYDAEICVEVSKTSSLSFEDSMVECKLPETLIKKPKDRRRTLAGNLGLLFSLSLHLLQKKFGIISYHSSVLVDKENQIIFLITGNTASIGKSVLMLEYLAHYGKDKNHQIVSCEMGHIRIMKNECRVYSGARFDNIALVKNESAKIALMKKLFPREKLPNESAKVKRTNKMVKTPVSLKDYYTNKDVYSSKQGFKLVYILPQIRSRIITKDPVLIKHTDSTVLDLLVRAAEEKLGLNRPVWFFEENTKLCLPAGPFISQRKKLEKTIGNSLQKKFLRGIIRIEGNPLDFIHRPGTTWPRIIQSLNLNYKS